ncbi:MAG TPA: M28 family peptidase [Chitinophagaceae bacterium]|nr:M28 family peptidase [Chitinophagaceae bacterium]
MNPLRLLVLAALLLTGFQGPAQKLRKADKAVITNLQKHIAFLASDALEGRRAGTHGEALAMDYISAQFRQIGLLPKGTDTYIQPFDIYDGRMPAPDTRLSINRNLLVPGTDYFPFPFSGDGQVDAQPALALQESGMPWLINLKEPLEENVHNPHFDLEDYLRARAQEAHRKGATAVLFYNTSALDDGLAYQAKDAAARAPLPVLYISKAYAKKNFRDPSASLDLQLKVRLEDQHRTGHNIIGYIDNGADRTIILGAHYDHLGYGEDGTSLLRTGEHLIHNGADDNASGTAALIELARGLKKSRLRHNNYLFIAFSGEELGLLGSKYFTEHPTIDLAQVNCMINMDMVGRLSDSTHVLTIGGYGTSPEWSALIHPAEAGSQGPRGSAAGLVVKIDSSGTGPSDHTSFYRHNIPVLFFFTGLHPDYHRPSDDADKINYPGEYQVIRYIQDLLAGVNRDPARLAFTPTREAASGSEVRFQVTLGIMPDYSYSGSGVRCDGVTDGRPAQKAGLRTGDVIIQLGDYHVTSLENYMQALGRFHKGDKTTVTYLRGGQTLQGAVVF